MITWNNKPVTDDANKVAIGSLTQWNFDAADLHVTAIVRTIVSTNSNFGFCLALQDDAIYRNMIFSSSEASDASRRPN
jgi:hypothetical protein